MHRARSHLTKARVRQLDSATSLAGGLRYVAFMDRHRATLLLLQRHPPGIGRAGRTPCYDEAMNVSLRPPRRP
jgi:hypothetical protein